jgi:hypothetical protein
MPQSVKVETKKQLTKRRRGAERLFQHMHDMNYLVGLQDKEEGNHTFDKAMPVWKSHFDYFGYVLLWALDWLDSCEAECKQLGAKIPAWTHAATFREWLAEYDIRPGMPVPKILSFEPEASQPFEREPNADDNSLMSGMHIKW